MPLSAQLELHHADVRDVLPTLADNSVDAVLADPPYGVRATRFTGGPDWDARDSIAFDPEFWAEIRRVVKPGASVLSFGHVRTVHRVASAMETAGLLIVDQLTWAKSHAGLTGNRQLGRDLRNVGVDEDRAQQFDGWHSQLRGSTEPIVVARKLRTRQSVAQAIAGGGTGGWNVDAARIADNGENRSRRAGIADERHYVRFDRVAEKSEPHAGGRHPTNLLLEHGPRCTDDACHEDCPATDVDASGRRKYAPGRERASRFFSRVRYSARAGNSDHPTTKPDAVAQWLATLVVQPGSVILDPFAGSGSLALAAAQAGAARVIAVEQVQEYCALIREKFAATA